MRHLFLLILFFIVLQTIKAQGACFNCGAVYKFQDASVPPEYHRSYTIIVSYKTAQLIIYSYDDTLLNEEYPIDNIRDFLTSLKGYKLSGKDVKNDNGCNGGTSESFFSYAGFSESSPPYKKVRLRVNAKIYHCGGKDYGGLKGNIADAVALFKSMIPDFDSKLAGTMK